jgi:hypothetical protein
MALLHGCAGRLAAKNGGFWPGAVTEMNKPGAEGKRQHEQMAAVLKELDTRCGPDSAAILGGDTNIVDVQVQTREHWNSSAFAAVSSSRQPVVVVATALVSHFLMSASRRCRRLCARCARGTHFCTRVRPDPCTLARLSVCVFECLTLDV